MGGSRCRNAARRRLRRAGLLALGVLAPFVAVGCSTLLGTAPAEQSIATTKFDPSLGINLSQMKETYTGVYYQDITVGTGQTVQSTDTIWVTYKAWLSDATLVEQGDSVPLPLGVGLIIPGLDDGITGEGTDPMKVGGERKLVIPPGQAYGDQGYHSNGINVPGGKILVFDIVLKAIGGLGGS